MPLYIDIHELGKVTAEDLAKAHAAHLKLQGQYGVEYSSIGSMKAAGRPFVWSTHRNPEAAHKVHRESHGMVAEKLIEVQPAIAESFLGATEINPFGAVLLPGGKPHERDPCIRRSCLRTLSALLLLLNSLETRRRWTWFVCTTRCPQGPRRFRWSRGKAHRGRNHGIVSLGGSSHQICHPGRARPGQTQAG